MSNLDAGAIREVERLTREAQPILTVKGEQQGVYFVREPNGEYTRERATLDPHNATVFDLSSLLALAEQAHGAVEADALYVHDAAAVLLNSDGHVRWTATLELPQHPAFALLSELRRARLYSQRDLVRVLRTELSEYVNPTIITMFSVLKFASSNNSTSSVKPAADGLDRNIMRRVQAENGGEMPEQILFRVPVYDIPEARGDRYEVRVYVEYDHEHSAFLLAGVHNDLRAAQETAVQRVMEHLRGHTQLPVYYGKPS